MGFLKSVLWWSSVCCDTREAGLRLQAQGAQQYIRLQPHLQMMVRVTKLTAVAKFMVRESMFPTAFCHVSHSWPGGYQCWPASKSRLVISGCWPAGLCSKALLYFWSARMLTGSLPISRWVSWNLKGVGRDCWFWEGMRYGMGCPMAAAPAQLPITSATPLVYSHRPWALSLQPDVVWTHCTTLLALLPFSAWAAHWLASGKLSCHSSLKSPNMEEKMVHPPMSPAGHWGGDKTRKGPQGLTQACW